jgi:hypothetical protein
MPSPGDTAAMVLAKLEQPTEAVWCLMRNGPDRLFQYEQTCFHRAVSAQNCLRGQ